MLFLISVGVLYWIYKNRSTLEEKIKNQCGEELKLKIYSRETIIRLVIASLFILFGIFAIGGYFTLGCILMLISVFILLYEMVLAYKKTNIKYGTMLFFAYILLLFVFLIFELHIFAMFIMGIVQLFGLFWI